jgi:hypothetical protein
MTGTQREKILLNKHLLKTQDFRDLLEKPTSADFIHDNSNFPRFDEKNLLNDEENNFEKESFIKYIEKDKETFLNKDEPELMFEKQKPEALKKKSAKRENLPSQKNLEFMNTFSNMSETQKYRFPSRPITSTNRRKKIDVQTSNTTKKCSEYSKNILLILFLF